MPVVALDPSGVPFQVFLNAGDSTQVWLGVPDQLVNPETGATETALVYWEPYPATDLEEERGPELTAFSYTQGSSFSPDGNPASVTGASLLYWKEVTNPGRGEQSFVVFFSVLP